MKGFFSEMQINQKNKLSNFQLQVKWHHTGNSEAPKLLTLFNSFDDGHLKRDHGKKRVLLR